MSIMVNKLRHDAYRAPSLIKHFSRCKEDEMEIDDQGLDKLPQDQLRKTVKVLLERYPGAVNFDHKPVEDSLEKFSIIKTYSNWFIKNVINVSLGYVRFSILTVDLSYEVARTSKYHSQVNTYHECQLYGFVKISHSLGKVLIRPESLQDKFVELFVHKEVDFPKHQQFSQKFYVLAEHPKRVKEGLGKDFLDQCCLLDGMVAEFSDDALLITSQRIVSSQETIKYCAFFEKILNGSFL